MSVLVAGLLLFAGQTARPPWEQDWPKGMAWAVVTDDHDRFWIMPDEIKRDPNSRKFSVWLHGEHSQNRLATYRTSLWKFWFSCDGSVTLLAYTTWKADGHTEEWDGFHSSAIRPGTMYQDIERKFCGPQ